MTKITTQTAVVAALLISPSFSFPSYLIELNCGAKFVTERYWEQKHKICFDYSGGVITFDRNLVRNIRDTDLPPPEEIKPSPSEETPTAEKNKSEKEQKPETEASTIEGESVEERYMHLKERREEVQRNFWKAKAEKKVEEKEQALSESNDLFRQIQEIEQKVKKANQGVLPEWWKGY